MLKTDRNVSYQQCLFPADRAARERRRDGRRCSATRSGTICEFIRFGGRVTASALPVVRFTTRARLFEIVDIYERHGVFVANPHVFTLEDGSRHKRADADQLGFKAEVDPLRPAQSRQDAQLHARRAHEGPLRLLPSAAGKFSRRDPRRGAGGAATRRATRSICSTSTRSTSIPCSAEEGRRHYHDEPVNQAGLEPIVARLQAAEAIVLQFPTWCFGPPAMLKGFFDRVFMPGVAFDLSDPAHVKPMLGNIRKIAGVVTYGRPRLMALWMGDPPRKIVTRYVRWFAGARREGAISRALPPQRRHADAQRAGFRAPRARGDGAVLAADI